QLSVGEKTCQFGAGSGSTRRSVVCFTWAQYKIFAVHSGHQRGCEQLDVIDLVAAVASDAMSSEGFPYSPCEIGKRFHVVQSKFKTVIFDEKQPIPTARDISS